MNSLFDEDDDRTSTADREFTLSTGTILGIFFALVLLCGAFFGFGYKMGSHKPAPVLQAAPEASSGPLRQLQQLQAGCRLTGCAQP